MNHIQKTKKGLLWSFIDQIGKQLVTLVINIVLARLILPSEFGLLGMVAVFISFASLFIDFGFSSVLIQKQEVKKEDLDTVFVCNIIVAVFLYLLFFSIAPLLAQFYDEPRLTLITRVAAITFLIAPIASIKPVLVAKSMNFKLSTKISLFSLLVGAVVAIVLALKGFGVWSIVFQSLTNTLLSSICYKVISEYQPSFRFSKTSFKAMFSMGSSIVGDSVVNYWTRNADDLLVGKFLGKESLGVYSRAYSLMLLPLTNITRVIVRVMLPSFSLIKNNIEEVKRIYLRTAQIIAAITFPMMFGLSAVSDSFVLTVFGKNWIAMIPLIRVLSIVGALQSILALNGSIYVSQGKANIAFRVTLVFNLIFLSGFVIGMYIGGLKGVAYSYFITSIIGAIPNLFFAIRLIHTSLIDLAKKLYKIVFLSAVMGLIVFLTGYLRIVHFNSYFIQLIALIGIGFFVYLGLIFLFKEEIYIELMKRLYNKRSLAILKETKVEV